MELKRHEQDQITHHPTPQENPMTTPKEITVDGNIYRLVEDGDKPKPPNLDTILGGIVIGPDAHDDLVMGRGKCVATSGDIIVDGLYFNLEGEQDDSTTCGEYLLIRDTAIIIQSDDLFPIFDLIKQLRGATP
jgi:hypothetical protein